MFERFFPDTTVSSTYAIDYEKLYEEGYRGILFDIDNTLVEHGKEATEQAKRLFSRLKKIGYECCLISNNKRNVFIRLMRKLVFTRFLMRISRQRKVIFMRWN